MTRNASPGISHRLTIGLALLVATVFVASCTSAQGPVDLAPNMRAEAPKPLGTVEGAQADQGTKTKAECGDPTVSLRPEPLPPPGQMPAGSTMATIQERGYLIAGVDQNTFLFGYRNPKTGGLEGFDIDMVRNVARAIFGDPAKVQYKAINSAQRVNVLRRGQVDMVARTMTINCERREQVNFSAVYYVAGQSVLVDGRSTVRSLNDLGGKRVCAANESTSIKTIAENGANPIPVSVPDWSDCLVLLQQNQVEAVSTDDTILAGLSAQDPSTRLVGEPFTTEEYGLAVPRQNEDFVRFLNGVLEKMRRDGEWQRSYDRWIARLLPDRQGQPQPKYS